MEIEIDRTTMDLQRKLLSPNDQAEIQLEEQRQNENLSVILSKEHIPFEENQQDKKLRAKVKENIRCIESDIKRYPFQSGEVASRQVILEACKKIKIIMTSSNNKEELSSKQESLKQCLLETFVKENENEGILGAFFEEVLPIELGKDIFLALYDEIMESKNEKLQHKLYKELYFIRNKECAIRLLGNAIQRTSQKERMLQDSGLCAQILNCVKVGPEKIISEIGLENIPELIECGKKTIKKYLDRLFSQKYLGEASFNQYTSIFFKKLQCLQEEYQVQHIAFRSENSLGETDLINWYLEEMKNCFDKGKEDWQKGLQEGGAVTDDYEKSVEKIFATNLAYLSEDIQQNILERLEKGEVISKEKESLLCKEVDKIRKEKEGTVKYRRGEERWLCKGAIYHKIVDWYFSYKVWKDKKRSKVRPL